MSTSALLRASASVMPSAAKRLIIVARMSSGATRMAISSGTLKRSSRAVSPPVADVQ
jgi:hypothetical protein